MTRSIANTKSGVASIYGVGATKALALNAVGIFTTTDLRKSAKEMKRLTSTQKKGLLHHSKISKRISRAIAQKHIAYIKQKIRGATVTGSYRRKRDTVGDIDILITSPLDRAIAKLGDYITVKLACGEYKFSGLAKLPNTKHYIRIDIIKTKPSEKAFALLYFTGSATYNIKMRIKARTMGYMLSQHGLQNIHTKKYVSGLRTERSIFEYLKMVYVPPSKRNKCTTK